MSLIDLYEVQVGAETTFGTAVTPTKLLQGVTDIKLEIVRDGKVFAYKDGTFSPGRSAKTLKKGARGSIEANLTYENAIYFLGSFFAYNNAPTGSNPYVYAYAGALGSLLAPKPLTLMYTDGTLQVRVTSLVFNKLTITGASGEESKIKAEFIAYDIDTSTEASLSQIAMDEVLPQHWLLYMDAIGGTVGTTAVTATAYAFEYMLDAHRTLKYPLGSLLPSGYAERKWSGNLKLNMELTATARTKLGSIFSGTDSPLTQLTRLKASSGSKVAQFDFGGACVAPSNLGEDEDGIAMYEFNFDLLEDAGAFANHSKASITNTLATAF